MGEQRKQLGFIFIYDCLTDGFVSVSVEMLAGCLLIVLVAAVSADTKKMREMYGKEGGEVALTPGAVTAPITRITWKVDGNLAMEWDGKGFESYRHFEKRGQLNTSTGVMTIRELIQSDSSVYTADINGNMLTPIHLIVISAVPAPTINKVCEEETRTCELICDGNTTGAEPVSYKWRLDDQEVPVSSEKKYIIKEDSSGVKEFRCELVNPVSRGTSQPVTNPLVPQGGKRPVRISTGVTVFICLLVSVLLLVFIHKWKTGIWFYEKASMPWEADFWRRGERPQSNTADSNGTATNQLQGESDEETAMK